MIALDSSAVIAIVGGEPTADCCMEVLGTRREVVMSAGTLTEVIIVATSRRLLNEVERLISASVTGSVRNFVYGRA
jgi:ribonuclease VapC